MNLKTTSRILLSFFITVFVAGCGSSTGTATVGVNALSCMVASTNLLTITNGSGDSPNYTATINGSSISLGATSSYSYTGGTISTATVTDQTTGYSTTCTNSTGLYGSSGLGGTVSNGYFTVTSSVGTGGVAAVGQTVTLTATAVNGIASSFLFQPNSANLSVLSNTGTSYSFSSSIAQTVSVTVTMQSTTVGVTSQTISVSFGGTGTIGGIGTIGGVPTSIGTGQSIQVIAYSSTGQSTYVQNGYQVTMPSNFAYLQPQATGFASPVYNWYQAGQATGACSYGLGTNGLLQVVNNTGAYTTCIVALNVVDQYYGYSAWYEVGVQLP